MEKTQPPIPPDEQRTRREYAHYLNEKGNEAYKNRNWEEAIRYYKEALKYSPDDPVIRQNLKKLSYIMNRLRLSKIKEMKLSAGEIGRRLLKHMRVLFGRIHSITRCDKN